LKRWFSYERKATTKPSIKQTKKQKRTEKKKGTGGAIPSLQGEESSRSIENKKKGSLPDGAVEDICHGKRRWGEERRGDSRKKKKEARHFENMVPLR